MKTIITALLLSVACAQSASASELFTLEEKKKMIQLTLDNFWGKAIDSQGNPVQPKDDKERKTVPISQQQAMHIINKGGESGVAQWCGVSWEERYQLIIAQLRQHLSSDTQVAYAGVLHGVAQHMLLSSTKNETCDADTKKQMQELMADEVKNLKLSVAGK